MAATTSCPGAFPGERGAPGTEESKSTSTGTARVGQLAGNGWERTRCTVAPRATSRLKTATDSPSCCAPQPWLNSVQLSKIPVMVLNIWRVTPWYMLILLSGLQSINPELYQAAMVDGAGPARRLFSITIPSLAAVIFFCFLTETIDSFRIFTEPYIMTGGGPGSSSLSIVQYLYESGFTVFKLGYASAIGYVLTLILLVISAMQVIFMRRRGSVVEGRAQ